MSKIEVVAYMCDDEFGCSDYVVTIYEWVGVPAEWGIETRDANTAHLCWDCVYWANEYEKHYLRTENREKEKADG